MGKDNESIHLSVFRAQGIQNIPKHLALRRCPALTIHQFGVSSATGICFASNVTRIIPDSAAPCRTFLLVGPQRKDSDNLMWLTSWWLQKNSWRPSEFGSLTFRSANYQTAKLQVEPWTLIDVI